MDRADVVAYYNQETAQTYDARFLLAEWPKHGSDFELGLLEDLLSPDGSWLDVGCGTGYFLSKFPGVNRAGVDLSPSQLAVAATRNPGVALHHADFIDDVPEWTGAWQLVSCMWTPWCYLQSMDEVEVLVQNLVNWTAPRGSLLLTGVTDMEDLRPHTMIEYDEAIDVWGGNIAIPGYFWTWQESSGIESRNMVAVHSEHFLQLLDGSFDTIELVRYPPIQDGWVARKAVVATGRRSGRDGIPSQVKRQPAPPRPTPDVHQPTPPQLASTLPVRTMLKEVLRRTPSIAKRILWRRHEEVGAGSE